MCMNVAVYMFMGMCIWQWVCGGQGIASGVAFPISSYLRQSFSCYFLPMSGYPAFKLLDSTCLLVSYLAVGFWDYRYRILFLVRYGLRKFELPSSCLQGEHFTLLSHCLSPYSYTILSTFTERASVKILYFFHFLMFSVFLVIKLLIEHCYILSLYHYRFIFLNVTLISTWFSVGLVFFFLKFLVGMICLSWPCFHIWVSFRGHFYAHTNLTIFLFEWIFYLPLENYCLPLAIIGIVGISSISLLPAVCSTCVLSH